MINSAQNAFIAECLKISSLLADITDHCENHFGFDPDAIDWGHVGTAAKVAADLRQIAAMLGKEGEFSL